MSFTSAFKQYLWTDRSVQTASSGSQQANTLHLLADSHISRHTQTGSLREINPRGKKRN